MHEPPPLPTTRLSMILATVPVLALTVGVPFANRLEPRILGLPFLLAYILAWIVLAPAFLTTVYALDRAAASRRK